MFSSIKKKGISMNLYKSHVSLLESMPDIFKEHEVKSVPKDIPEIEGISHLAIMVALNRGIEKDDLNNFFSPQISSYMPNPSILSDLDESADVILNGIHDGVKFGLIGDYDVDGATSVSEVVVFLRDAGVADGLIEFYIPQRLSEGYGMNIDAVKKLYDNDARILMVLDSGTLSNEPIAYAKSLGMQVIVVDHHMPGEGWTKPDALIINPQLSEETKHLRNLCTAGLVFILLQKVRQLMNQIGYPKIPSLIKLSGLAALGTVSDLMQLRGLNRALVSQGIPHLDDVLGLSALTTKTMGKPGERKKITSRSLGFNIGPCINAGGRISDCMKGSELLTCQNESEAIDKADELFKINSERQALQKRIEAEALEMANEITDQSASVIILRNEEWHPGVIGIVASRILTHMNRPIIIIGKGGKGSGRSCHDFDLGSAVIEARNAGLLKTGGGHALACGVGVKDEEYENFVRFMHDKSKDIVRKPERVDFELSLSDLSKSLVRSLEALAPFGAGNSVPVILLKDCFVTDIMFFGPDKKHLKLAIEYMGNRQFAIFWNAKDTLLGTYLSSNVLGKTLSLVTTIAMNEKFASNPIDIVIKDVVERV